MQRLSQGRLRRSLPPGSELWLDGGHNPDGGRAIANALADLEERVSRPLVLVVGMLATKDCEGFLKNFAGLARRTVGCRSPIRREPFGRGARRYRAQRRHPAQSSENIEAALAAIGRFELLPPPRILITGSLYLAGAVLHANGTVADVTLDQIVA